MNESDKHHLLLEATALGSVNDVAHALIYFEKPDPTIAESVQRAVDRLITNVFSLIGREIKQVNRDKLEKAVQIRRARLGDALWFSRF